MVYTTFAIIATGILITLVSFTTVDTDYTTDKNPFRVGQASNYIESVEDDYSRAQKIAIQRGISGLTNYVIRTGRTVENPDTAIRNATVYGNVSGVYLNNTGNATLVNWEQRIKQAARDSQYRVDIKYGEMNVNDTYFNLTAGLETKFTLYDPETLARFNESGEYNQTITIEGLEDPLLLQRTAGRYISTFNQCNFDQPAVRTATGQNTNDIGPTYGEVTQDTNAADPEEKILKTENPPQPAQANEFAGLATTQDDLNTSYADVKWVAGLTDQEYSNVETGETLILYEDRVYTSHFRQMVRGRCYLKSSQGPGFEERLSDQVSNSPGENTGLATLLNKEELPVEVRREDDSNLAYRYFGENDQNLQKIAGVTGDQAHDSATRENYRELFRLTQDTLDRWNIPDLGY